ncbi:MAG: chromosome partitioning protein ParA, partial [Rhodothermales bacterium]|nr:chromosome partitioning protein ParA [Rhodothermales bacterium]
EQSDGENQRSEENRERLAEEQEMTADEMRALEEKMEQTLERMEELRNQPTEEFQDMSEDLQDQNMPQQMEDNASEIRENQLDSAQQQQQQMSENLQSFQSQMSDMQMSMQGAQMQMNTAAIRAALEDVLTLSRQQEDLRLQITDVASDSPLLRPAAQRQAHLSDGLRIVSDSLQSIAREVPQMSRAVQEQAGNALREMSESTGALTERQSRQAAGHQRGAMTSLNELALMLSELMNQMMNGSGQGSSNMSMEQMTQQLQQMGQQQQELNRQIQQLLNDMQGNRLTQDMQERLRQLGSQQEQIRSDLRQLSRERDAQNKLLGDLNRIAEQMAESIEEMQQSRVSRRTVQRQQQILTRLLEASKSLQERGKDNKRQGRTAEEILRESPADLTPAEQAERLRRDLIRALETGYSADYQDLIRRYFELLQNRESAAEQR